eukprot:1136993-Pelagomonas_calceolata.AAC.8
MSPAYPLQAPTTPVICTLKCYSPILCRLQRPLQWAGIASLLTPAQCHMLRLVCTPRCALHPKGALVEN